MADTDLEKLVINVGTTAQIEAGISGGTITQDMLSITTDGAGYVESVNNVTPDSNGNVTIQIPAAVTESTVAGWGFTKNTGTVTKVNNVSPVNGNVSLSIPTDTSDLTNGAGFITGISSSDVTTALGYTPYNSTNPSGYITSSALSGYATQTWVGQQGYLTSSDLSNYARLDTAQTFTGNQAFTGGLYRKAVWAVGTAPSSLQYNTIQLQDSTGYQWGSVGLRYNTDGSLEVRQNIRHLDKSNNFATFSLISKADNTTSIKNVSDEFVFESSGDTRFHLRNESLTKGTNPSSTVYNQIVFEDGSNSSTWQNSRLGIIQHQIDTSGTTKIQLSATRFYAGSGSSATIEAMMTKNGVASCSFPNTTCVDSVFTAKAVNICSDVDLNGSGGYDYTLTDLPDDGQNYMVLIHATVISGSTSGNNALVQIKSSVLTSSLNVVRAYTRTSSTMQASASAWVPVGSNRVLHLNQSTGWHGTASIDMRGYRRIGTNS